MKNRNNSKNVPTIRDVARLAGVSISTASLTFRNSDRVNPETARRIWSAAEQLDYRPNPIAQSLKRGHSPVIGMLVGDISSPFSGRLLKATEKQALKRGYLMIVSDTDADPDRELALLRQLVEQRVGGIVFTPQGIDAAYGETLRSIQTPMVMVDHRYLGLDLDYVGSDSRLAVSMLTEHLLNLGHRRIAQISGPPQLYTAAIRIEAFRKTLETAGIAADPTLIVDGKYRQRDAYDQTMRLLTRPDRPTAIIAASNAMAIGTLQAIQELGIRCPEEISLTMMDHMPAHEVIRPKMTLVEQDVERIAEISMEYLFDRMDGRVKDPTPRETVLPPRLVLGNSTAPVQTA